MPVDLVSEAVLFAALEASHNWRLVPRFVKLTKITFCIWAAEEI
jgi:hypothetical protein